MIPYKQITEPLFSVGDFHVQAWGLMVSIGFLAALMLIANESLKRNLKKEDIYSIALAILLGGIIGGRIGWIITESSGLSFLDYFKIWNGGLIWYGGFVGGFILAIAYMIYRKLDILKHLDAVAIGLPLGMAIGRVGCYLIGDHLGKGTVMPWAILHYGQLTHPVILYEIILLLGIFTLIWKLKDQKLKSGMLFATYLLTYSIGRFLIDFARADPTYYGLTIAQYVSISFTMFIILFWAVFWRNK